MNTLRIRLQSGIDEAQANLDREMAYSEDFRKTEVIRRSKAHIKKLSNIMDKATTQAEVIEMLYK
jgi:hypothetical protein